MQFIVPTLFGLEGLAGDELRRMNMENVKVEDRRVFFTGDEYALAKANICLRTGERVMIVLAQFPAKTFEELFQGVYHANLEDYIPKDGQFPVKGHCLNSQLMSVSDCQAIIKKAASKRLGEKYGISWLPETGIKFQLHFTILNDQVTLSLDTSGQGLHKRGYRAIGNDAPLHETLAAGMIQLTRYRGREYFWDPFCGSGTIPIEAALIAKNRAPGLNRTFAAMEYPWMNENIWKQVKEEARDKEFNGQYRIVGSDNDPSCVSLCFALARNPGSRHDPADPLQRPGVFLGSLLRLRHHPHRSSADRQEPGTRSEPYLRRHGIPLDERKHLEAGEGRGTGQGIQRSVPDRRF